MRVREQVRHDLAKDTVKHAGRDSLLVPVDGVLQPQFVFHNFGGFRPRG